MNSLLRPAFCCLAALFSFGLVAGAEPDYAEWNRILKEYYDPVKGMDYGGLKARELPALSNLKARLAVVDPASLDRAQRLAYWINLYNIATVSLVAESYPIRSIKELSHGWNPYQVFTRTHVKTFSGELSLKAIEDERLRAGFADARIHFAINCASRSCPPLRTEAYVGDRLNAQLDEQTRGFLTRPGGVRISQEAGRLRIEVNPILKWYREDFQLDPGGLLGFLRRYVPPNEAAQLQAASTSVEFRYTNYDWTLNDWRRGA